MAEKNALKVEFKSGVKIDYKDAEYDLHGGNIIIFSPDRRSKAYVFPLDQIRGWEWVV